MEREPKTFWIDLIRKYFLESCAISVAGLPSREEKTKLMSEERTRIEKQVSSLGKEGLRRREDVLRRALEINERQPPEEVVSSVAIPKIKSITFHSIRRFRTDLKDKSLIDLSSTPVFTYFDHLKTNFVYVSRNLRRKRTRGFSLSFFFLRCAL